MTELVGPGVLQIGGRSGMGDMGNRARGLFFGGGGVARGGQGWGCTQYLYGFGGYGFAVVLPLWEGPGGVISYRARSKRCRDGNTSA